MAGPSVHAYPVPHACLLPDGMVQGEINAPDVLKRINDALPAPDTCRYCGEDVELVNNAIFYGGRSYGWPLAYACSCCGARVGCHPGTTVPLGTLADKPTMAARRAAHAAFDPLWQNKGPGSRSRAYRALSKAMGRKASHISWMDIEECQAVVALIASGKVRIDTATNGPLQLAFAALSR